MLDLTHFLWISAHAFTKLLCKYLGLDIHGGSYGGSYRFKCTIVVAVAFLKGPLIMDVRSPTRGVWLLSSCCYEGQSIYSWPFPELRQLPDAPSEHEQRAYSVARECRVEKKLCATVYVCVRQYIKLGSVESVCTCIQLRGLCVGVFVSISVHV